MDKSASETNTPPLLDVPAELDKLRSEISLQKEFADLRKELADLRLEVTLELRHFKWVAWTASVLGALLVGVAGFVGIKAWTDLTGTVQRAYEKQLGELGERYSNISRGFSLADSGRFQDAVPYLLPLFETNPYDDPVVRTLLRSLLSMEDCETGARVVAQVKKNEKRFMNFKDPFIYNIAGAIIRDCSTLDPASIKESREMSELTLKRLAADDRDRRHALYSMFVIGFITGDQKVAERYLREAVSIDGTFLGDPPTDELWMKQLSKQRGTAQKELAAIWKRVVKQGK